MKQYRGGDNSFKPLQHKDGTQFDDIDYLELLGRECLKLDAENTDKRLPTKYPEGYDLDTVNLAKEVVKGLDSGMTHADLQKYLNTVIEIPEGIN